MSSQKTLSDKKLEANRRNARLSTGPKTPEGKARSRLNALKHGLAAADAVLPDESEADFAELLAALEGRLQPADPLEHILVQQIASAHWRLRRLQRMETGLIWSRLDEVREHEYGAPAEDDEEQPAPVEDYDDTTRLLGLAFLRDVRGADTLTRLARYEAMIRRSLYRALENLNTLRALPAAPPPPAPAAPAPPRPTPQKAKAQNEPTAPPSPAPAARISDAPPGPQACPGPRANGYTEKKGPV